MGDGGGGVELDLLLQPLLSRSGCIFLLHLCLEPKTLCPILCSLYVAYVSSSLGILGWRLFLSISGLGPLLYHKLSLSWTFSFLAKQANFYSVETLDPV